MGFSLLLVGANARSPLQWAGCHQAATLARERCVSALGGPASSDGKRADVITGEAVALL
jgi:hypothetical protein